jgi:hypothetical protein
MAINRQNQTKAAKASDASSFFSWSLSVAIDMHGYP